jgi:zinc protease
MLGLGLLLAGAAPAQAKLFEPERFTLANGLEVVVLKDKRAPIVSQTIWYKAGAADEPPGRSGLAHLLEHMMFKGTRKVRSGEFSRTVANLGGRENAFTGHDWTAYYQIAASRHLETLMRLEADRMRNLSFGADAVQSERRVVLEEQLSRVANEPKAQLVEQMDAVQYLGHPYGRPVIGWPEEIERLRLRDLRAFYDRYYAPNNALLVIAGDVDAKDVARLAERHYGPIARRQEPGRLRAEIPPQTSERRLRHESDQAGLPLFRRTYLAPSRSAGASRHALPLLALAQILGGGRTSRLYRALVVDAGAAADVRAWYDDLRLDPTDFGIEATPRPDGAIGPIEAAIDAVIAGLLDEGVTEEELKRAKTQMLAETVYARDDIFSAARYVGAALASGVPLEEIESLPERLAALSVADVNASARHVFKPERSVSGELRPKAASRPGP